MLKNVAIRVKSTKREPLVLRLWELKSHATLSLGPATNNFMPKQCTIYGGIVWYLFDSFGALNRQIFAKNIHTY